jgi:hypothetical protein
MSRTPDFRPRQPAPRGAQLLCALILAGCATPPPQPPARFTKPGATQEQFMADRYACYQAAQQPVSGSPPSGNASPASMRVVASRNLWLMCMSEHGYTLDPDGPLVAPAGKELPFLGQ